MDISIYDLNIRINNNKSSIDTLKLDYKSNKEILNLLIIENKNLKFRIIELEENIKLINKFLNIDN